MNTSKDLEVEAPYKDLHLTIRNAFKAARRQVQDYVRLQRRDFKTHDTGPRARITRLFPQKGYGFLTTPDGRELYFYRDAVLKHAFGRLEVGAEVTFAEEQGEKGTQASTVKLPSRHDGDYTLRSPLIATDCSSRMAHLRLSKGNRLL